MSTGIERDYVGYGSTPPLVRWPGGARVAVSIVLNYEEGSELSIARGDDREEDRPMWAGFTWRTDERNTMRESNYEYGSRVGIWRLLSVLRRHKVCGTIFATGMALEMNPEVGRVAIRDGHEVCSHGYRWAALDAMSPEEEQESISRSIEAIESITGKRPIGWYTRGGITEHTRGLLVDAGIVYDSNAFNDDLPYYVDVGGRPHLVVPYAADTNDGRLWGGTGPSTGAGYFAVLKETLDYLLIEAEEVPRMMSVGFHMRIGGRPFIAGALDKFLAYAGGLDGVWFARRDEIARWWLEHSPPSDASTEV